ncbi:MAG: phenylalanine--tRNA ligase subunit beta [archaeon]
MPVIEISKKDLCNLVGKNMTKEEIEEMLHFTKSTLESDEGDLLKVEAGDANRPDLWTVEGIARVIKGQTGKETGMPDYKVANSNYVVNIEENVAKVRPLTVCAVVKNLKFDEESIKQMIQLQEKLCEGFGLGRKEAALGVYDLDKIKWPITYTAFSPDKLKFVPLEMDKPLTLKEILQKHDKGRQYAHLLKDAAEYPIFIDNAKEVLSMPPIINSNYTGKVTADTKNVFIEVSGFSYNFITPILNIIVCALSDRGGKIEKVTILNGKSKITTPDLSAQSKTIDADYCNSIIGLNLKQAEICNLLKKARFDAKSQGGKITVQYLPYRQDIMDDRDVIEDVAIAYGYSNLAPEETRVTTIGKPSEISEEKRKISELLIGLGMQEIATFTLTNKNNLFKKVNKPEGNIVEVANPISENYACLRDSLVPSMLEFLSANTKKEFPQKVFEMGEVYNIEKECTQTRLSVAITHSKVNFTEIRQILDNIARSRSIPISIGEKKDNSFIEGRTGAIIKDEKEIGIIGEVHPKVLSIWNIEMPCSILEITLEN